MCAVARNSSLLHEYVIEKMLTPSFLGLGGVDISKVDGGNYAGLEVTDYSAGLLSGFDTLFIDYDENMGASSIYSEVIDNAKEIGLEIIISRKYRNVFGQEPITWPSNAPLVESSDEHRLYEIPIPIITILTQGARTDQFATELALRKHFIEEGYNVSQIGSYEASQFFGFHELPNFLYEQRDAYEKTLRFNRYVAGLVSREKPHVIIIGVPTGIMKYNNKLLEGLGFLPYIVCNAVRADILTLCMYHLDYEKIFYDETSQYGNYHFGTPIDFYCVANTSFVPEFTGSLRASKKNYVDIDSDYVLATINKNIVSGDFHLFNALDNGSIKSACITIQENLLNNVSSVR